jgi:universal stress protein A
LIVADYRHILFATDLSDECLYVGKHAMDLAQRYGAKLSLAHVVQLRDVGAGYEANPVLGETGTRMANEALLELTDLAKGLGVEEAKQWVVQSSSVAHQIHRLADEHNVDLIVVGSHGTHGLALLLGSTSSEVLHGAHCDVLAVWVRPPKS